MSLVRKALTFALVMVVMQEHAQDDVRGRCRASEEVREAEFRAEDLTSFSFTPDGFCVDFLAAKSAISMRLDLKVFYPLRYFGSNASENFLELFCLRCLIWTNSALRMSSATFLADR